MEPGGGPRLGGTVSNGARMPTTRGPRQTAVTVVGSTALLAVGLAFSVVVVAAVAVVATIGFGVLWWKTRAIRKQLQTHIDAFAQNQTNGPTQRQSAPHEEATGDIVEGEIIREEREPLR